MRAAAAVVLGAVLAGAAPARAEHTSEVHITDDAPYVLRPNEARLGLWKFQLGLPEAVRGLEVGTYLLPWLAWMADIRLVNLQVKYQLFDTGRFAASVGTGLFALSLENHDVPVTFAGMPFELVGAWRANRAFTFGAGIQGTYMRAGGEGAWDDDRFRGAVAANSLQLLATVEWRLGRVTALVASGRLVSYSTVSGSADAHFAIDDHTMLDAFAAGEKDIEGGLGGAVAVYAHFSWTHFNLKLGGSYGTYTVPGVNLVLPTRIFMPELDLFWRF
jgi:hypothetical protein